MLSTHKALSLISKTTHTKTRAVTYKASLLVSPKIWQTGDVSSLGNHHRDYPPLSLAAGQVDNIWNYQLCGRLPVQSKWFSFSPSFSGSYNSPQNKTTSLLQSKNLLTALQMVITQISFLSQINNSKKKANAIWHSLKVIFLANMN
jgi:hypothetical protein